MPAEFPRWDDIARYRRHRRHTLDTEKELARGAREKIRKGTPASEARDYYLEVKCLVISGVSRRISLSLRDLRSPRLAIDIRMR